MPDNFTKVVLYNSLYPKAIKDLALKGITVDAIVTYISHDDFHVNLTFLDPNIFSNKQNILIIDKRSIMDIDLVKKTIEDFILNTTYMNDIILDLSMGEGLVGSICKKLKRDYIGIENKTGFFEKARLEIIGCELYECN